MLVVCLGSMFFGGSVQVVDCVVIAGKCWAKEFKSFLVGFCEELLSILLGSAPLI